VNLRGFEKVRFAPPPVAPQSPVSAQICCAGAHTRDIHHRWRVRAGSFSTDEHAGVLVKSMHAAAANGAAQMQRRGASRRCRALRLAAVATIGTVGGVSAVSANAPPRPALRFAERGLRRTARRSWSSLERTARAASSSFSCNHRTPRSVPLIPCQLPSWSGRRVGLIERHVSLAATRTSSLRRRCLCGA